jgi:hypothetical protein
MHSARYVRIKKKKGSRGDPLEVRDYKHNRKHNHKKLQASKQWDIFAK